MTWDDGSGKRMCLLVLAATVLCERPLHSTSQNGYVFTLRNELWGYFLALRNRSRDAKPLSIRSKSV